MNLTMVGKKEQRRNIARAKDRIDYLYPSKIRLEPFILAKTKKKRLYQISSHFQLHPIVSLFVFLLSRSIPATTLIEKRLKVIIRMRLIFLRSCIMFKLNE